jgi:hypothetical protein
METSQERRALVPLLLAAALAAAPARAQRAEDQAELFEGEERVTAIDLAVAVRNVTGARPETLAPGDLAIEEEGERRPVVGVARLGEGEGAEPWRLVVWADLASADAATLQAVALNLAERTSALVRLGTVEVWVADPLPRPVLTPTQDRELVENGLARLLVEFKGREEQAELRRSVLAGVKDPASRDAETADLSAAELIVGAAAAELALVRRSADALLTWAAADRGSGPRALLWIGGGHDLDPGSFYRRLPGAPGTLPGPREATEATEQAARALAAYGWVVYPLSFSELGTGPSEPSRQFEAFRRQSLDGPRGEKTAVVGRSIPLGGRNRGPADAEGRPVEEAALLESPLAPLSILARESGGSLVDEPGRVEDLLADLGGRFRVTFQVARQVDGRLHRLEVRAARGGLSVQGPAWVRSSTPEVVAEARARRILEGEYEVGDLAVSARFRREAGQAPAAGDGLATGVLTTRLDLAAQGSRPPEPKRATLRLTVAYGREDGAPSFQHEVLTGQDLSGATWSHDQVLTLPADAEWIVVLVEELAGGAWGARDVKP